DPGDRGGGPRGVIFPVHVDDADEGRIRYPARRDGRLPRPCWRARGERTRWFGQPGEVYAMLPHPFPVPASSEPSGDRAKLEEAKGDIRALRETVAELQRRLEKQALLVRALFVLLSEHQGLTEAELLDHFRQAEAARATAPPRKCPDCGRG